MIRLRHNTSDFSKFNFFFTSSDSLNSLWSKTTLYNKILTHFIRNFIPNYRCLIQLIWKDQTSSSFGCRDREHATNDGSKASCSRIINVYVILERWVRFVQRFTISLAVKKTTSIRLDGQTIWKCRRTHLWSAVRKRWSIRKLEHWETKTRCWDWPFHWTTVETN